MVQPAAALGVALLLGKGAVVVVVLKTDNWLVRGLVR